MNPAVTRLKYCRYGVELYPSINQSINESYYISMKYVRNVKISQMNLHRLSSSSHFCRKTILKINVYLFVSCLWFLSHLRIFHSYGDVTITVKAANFDQYSTRLMTIERWGFFLACQTFCATAQPFIMVVSEDPCCQAFCSGAVTSCFLWLRSVAAWIRTPNLLHAKRTL